MAKHPKAIAFFCVFAIPTSHHARVYKRAIFRYRRRNELLIKILQTHIGGGKFYHPIILYKDSI